MGLTAGAVGEVAVVPLMLVLLLLLLLAIPALYWAAVRYPPPWRWLLAYVGMMCLAAAVLDVA
jgi:hypothetical protein